MSSIRQLDALERESFRESRRVDSRGITSPLLRLQIIASRDSRGVPLPFPAAARPNRVKDPPQFVNDYRSSLIAHSHARMLVLIVWPYTEYLLRAPPPPNKASLCLAALLIAHRHNSIFSPCASRRHSVCPFLLGHHKADRTYGPSPSRERKSLRKGTFFAAALSASSVVFRRVISVVSRGINGCEVSSFSYVAGVKRMNSDSTTETSRLAIRESF